MLPLNAPQGLCRSRAMQSAANGLLIICASSVSIVADRALTRGSLCTANWISTSYSSRWCTAGMSMQGMQSDRNKLGMVPMNWGLIQLSIFLDFPFCCHLFWHKLITGFRIQWTLARSYGSRTDGQEKYRGIITSSDNVPWVRLWETVLHYGLSAGIIRRCCQHDYSNLLIDYKFQTKVHCTHPKYIFQVLVTFVLFIL